MKYLVLITFCLWAISSAAQVPSFDQIYITSNVDSLKKLLPSKNGAGKLSTLLSIAKSDIVWKTKNEHGSLTQIERLLSKYPAARGHYLYFKAQYGEVNHSLTLEQTFLDSKYAYEQYKKQGDSTGMISALLNMATLNLKAESNAAKSVQYGHQYLKEAMNLGRKSTNAEFQIIGYYAFVRFVGMKTSPAQNKELKDMGEKTLNLIDKHSMYGCYKPFILNILSMLYEQKSDYVQAQKYNLELIQFYKQYHKPVPMIGLYNAGFYYEMQKKYTQALFYYQEALRVAHTHNEDGVKILFEASNGYHASLVGLKKYQEAAVWADSIYFYADRFYNQVNANSLQQAVVKYEVEKKEATNRLLKQEKELSEARSQLFFGGGMVLLAGLLGTVFLSYRLRNANLKLKGAFDEIVKLNQARDYFFGIIAHDLRRPLSSFQDMAELIKYYLNNKRYDELTKISRSIDQAGHRIRQLLDNLLNWALTQREEVPYYPENVVLYNKIQQVVELYEQTVQSQKAEIKVECPKNLTVYMDTNACDLIIRNLVDNALKNISANSMVIIKAVVDKTENLVEMIIKDNGCGMSSEKLASVNEILVHPEVLPDRQHGLGMILIGRFVNSNKGTIKVNSSLGSGTSFIMTFPIGN